MSTVVIAFLAQHHHDGGNACAEENIRRQTDDCLNMVVVNQIFANCAFFTTTEQHTVRQNDGHNAVVTQMVQVVQQEGIIRLGLGCYAIAEAWIFSLSVGSQFCE